MSSTTVRLKLGTHAPKFAETCVVCGQSCGRDQCLIKAWSKSFLPGADFTQTREFLVPMHQAVCARKYSFTSGLVTYGPLLIGLLTIMLAMLAHYIFHTDHYAAFIFLFAIIVGLPMILYLQASMPFVIYQTFTLGVYEFLFKRSEQAESFQALNADSVIGN